MSYRTGQRERDKSDPRLGTIAALYRDGFDKGAIGAILGLSDGRVKDLLQVAMPADERWAIYRGFVAQAAKDRRSRRNFDLLMERLTNPRKCAVCPGWNLRRQSRTTCSPECAKAWAAGRYQLDEEAHERHRRSNAQSVLAKPEKYANRVEWAERVLSDTPPEPNRRFVVPGSAAACALERSLGRECG